MFLWIVSFCCLLIYFCLVFFVDWKILLIIWEKLRFLVRFFEERLEVFNDFKLFLIVGLWVSGEDRMW